MTAQEQSEAAGLPQPAAPDSAVVVCLARARRMAAAQAAADEAGQRAEHARLLGAYNLHNG